MRAGLKIAGLSLVTIFSGLVLATIVLFLYYSIDWADNQALDSTTIPGMIERTIQVEYSYEGAVLALLFILSGMHGYVVLKKLL